MEFPQPVSFLSTPLFGSNRFADARIRESDGSTVRAAVWNVRGCRPTGGIGLQLVDRAFRVI